MNINGLEIKDLVEYINLELRKNTELSVNKLCDKLEIKRSTLKSKLTKCGYTYNFESRQYLKNDDSINLVVQTKNDEINAAQFNSDKSNKGVLKAEKQIRVTPVTVGDNNINLVIHKEYEANLIELAKNFDKIKNIIDRYDKEYYSKYDNSLAIELPLETVKDYRTSIRINNVVWEQFKDFCDTYKEFTQRDLHSMALKEYMEKYKKQL